ncbi:PAS domain S-box-containing protein [Streptomyces sp. 1222.5]|uniref:SpoIIE family protein phosphatase n=1 Tax=unclassified Streptomyces TaxID=2593676 RepID=UPI0008966BD2|nr:MULTISPECIES: SpoIIE family protein phosphatase [unclassified Streptomyces]PKW09704.1 PAS domain S-box-containing protein [Streptomyces sp. 5112.2]SEC27303.1 PAS domain S-box-containing protein [Streptomyces sp. 1222.5]
MGTPSIHFSESPEDPFALGRGASAVLDDRGTVVGWSARAQDLLGYPAKEVIGRPWRDLLVDSRDLPVARSAVVDAVKAGGWFGVVPVRHRDGRRLEMGFRARTVTREGGGQEWILVGAPAAEVIAWQRDRALLDGLYRRSPIGLVTYDPDRRVIRVNRAVEKASGVPAELPVGHRPREFMVDEDAGPADERVRHVLETGEPLIFTEQSARARHEPGRERIVSVSAFRMEDPSGRVLGVAETIEDVTDRHRAQRRLAMLNEASALIGTSLDVRQTARELADVAVEGLADYCSVDLLKPVTLGDEPSPNATGPLLRTALSPTEHRIPYREGDVVPLLPESAQARCLAERRPILEGLLSLRPEWYAMDRRRIELALGLGVHSLIAVPLIARGIVLGVVSLWRSRNSEPFEDGDAAVAQELSSRAAVCIDNARRFTQQQNTALTLQRSLLPSALSDLPAVEVACRYLPASGEPGLGGDWFDVIPLSGARVALVVGDVVGHGIHAAASMGRLRAAARTLASLDLEPDEVVARLDDLVSLLAGELEANADDNPSAIEQVLGATCLYAVYDPVSQRCSLARAGHPAPVVSTPDGEVTVLDLPAGPPLGLGGLPFETYDLDLPEGSLLTLYTDGLLEAGVGDVDTALDHLRTCLAATTESLEHTCHAVVEALLPKGHLPTDDVALLIARTRVLRPQNVASWELPLEATSAARARELTTAKLDEWGLSELAFTTELVASELVTNTYRYAAGPVTLRLIRTDTLICEVSDTSHTSPHLRRALSTDEGGRGLFLVAQLTERWGTRYTHDGKTVWTEQPLPAV